MRNEGLIEDVAGAVGARRVARADHCHLVSSEEGVEMGILSEFCLAVVSMVQLLYPVLVQAQVAAPEYLPVVLMCVVPPVQLLIEYIGGCETVAGRFMNCNGGTLGFVFTTTD